MGNCERSFTRLSRPSATRRTTADKVPLVRSSGPKFDTNNGSRKSDVRVLRTQAWEAVGVTGSETVEHCVTDDGEGGLAVQGTIAVPVKAPPEMEREARHKV